MNPLNNSGSQAGWQNYKLVINVPAHSLEEASGKIEKLLKLDKPVPGFYMRLAGGLAQLPAADSGYRTGNASLGRQIYVMFIDVPARCRQEAELRLQNLLQLPEPPSPIVQFGQLILDVGTRCALEWLNAYCEAEANRKAG